MRLHRDTRDRLDADRQMKKILGPQISLRSGKFIFAAPTAWPKGNIHNLDVDCDLMGVDATGILTDGRFPAVYPLGWVPP
jgi:hypothetical protein